MRALRPGSLTLLSILCFILGGFAALGALGGAMGLAMAATGTVPGALPLWVMAVTAGWSLLSAAMLIVGGIGLLRLTPWSGRWLLTAYALMDLALAGILPALEPELRRGLLGTVMGAAFPAVLLVWLHVVCRDTWRPPRIEAGVGGAAAGPVHPILLTAVQALRQNLRAVAGPGFLLAWIHIALGSVWAVTAIGLRIREGVEGHVDPSAGSDMLASAVAWAVSHLTGETGITPAQILSGAAADGGGTAARWARWLVIDHDPIASCAFLLLSLLVALLAPAATAGAIARDVGNRGFRFLLIRTGRHEVFWGRFLATAGLAMAMVALTGLLAGAGVAAARGGGTDQILWWAWAALALALTALPYLALGILASTVVGHPFGSLAVAKGAVVVAITLAISLGALWAPLIHVIHLLPIAPQLYLFHPDPGVAAAAAGGCLAYTAFYLALARAHFLRRDL